MGGLFSDGEEATAPEDISKWTVDDVCSFVGGLSGCGEYTQVRGHLPKMVLSWFPRASPHPHSLPERVCRGHCAGSGPNPQCCTFHPGVCPSFLSHEYFPYKQLLLAVLSKALSRPQPPTHLLSELAVLAWLRDPAGWAGCSHSGPDRLPPHQVFREQGIDGETLPLLTEEHLLTTMGLKLGPALKIRAQVRASGVVVPPS